MRLPRLTLQAMLLLAIMRVIMSALARVRSMRMDVLLVLLDALRIHIIEDLHAELDIAQQLVASRLAEILTHDDAQHLEILGVRGHGVGGDDPGTAAELMGKRELVVVLLLLRVEAEGDEGETFAVLLGHDDEAELLERIGEVVCGAGQVGHDGAVSVLSEADELVVLANDLGGALGEIESEGGLVSTEVVDVEDEFFGEVFGCTPDDPAYTWVDEAVPVLLVEKLERERILLVAGGVDRDHLLESEIPLQFRNHEWSHESSRSSINVNDRINLLLDQQIINLLSILVLSCVSCAKNDADTNGILVNQVDGLLGINDISLRCAVNIFLLDLEISGRLLPADLNCRAHDNVWLIPRLASSLTSILPALLHGQNSQHDRLRGSHSRGTDCSSSFFVDRGIEESADHRHTAVLDVGGLGVFFVVDEILGEGFGHEVFDFFFLFAETC